MEENIGLFATNWNVRGTSRSYWVWRGGDILVIPVFFSRLRFISLDGLHDVLDPIDMMLENKTYRLFSKVGIWH
jgi:hypothetical protein